MSNTHNRMTQN